MKRLPSRSTPWDLTRAASVRKAMGSRTTPFPMTPWHPLRRTPQGMSWRTNLLPEIMTVWPALCPPAYRATQEKWSLSTSTIFPLPSSPHWLNREGLTADVQAYDAEIDRGRPSLPTISCGGSRASGPTAATACAPAGSRRSLIPRPDPAAIREFILSRKSLGGIQTDLACRVLRDDGLPIPGLYAVGEAAGFGGGGIHGRGSLEGTFLGSCVLTGRVAARSITGRT